MSHLGVLGTMGLPFFKQAVGLFGVMLCLGPAPVLAQAVSGRGEAGAYRFAVSFEGPGLQFSTSACDWAWWAALCYDLNGPCDFSFTQPSLGAGGNCFAKEFSRFRTPPYYDGTRYLDGQFKFEIPPVPLDPNAEYPYAPMSLPFRLTGTIIGYNRGAPAQKWELTATGVMDMYVAWSGGVARMQSEFTFTGELTAKGAEPASAGDNHVQSDDVDGGRSSILTRQPDLWLRRNRLLGS